MKGAAATIIGVIVATKPDSAGSSVPIKNTLKAVNAPEMKRKTLVSFPAIVGIMSLKKFGNDRIKNTLKRRNNLGNFLIRLRVFIGNAAIIRPSDIPIDVSIFPKPSQLGSSKKFNISSKASRAKYTAPSIRPPFKSLTNGPRAVNSPPIPAPNNASNLPNPLSSLTASRPPVTPL